MLLGWGLNNVFAERYTISSNKFKTPQIHYNRKELRLWHSSIWDLSFQTYPISTNVEQVLHLILNSSQRFNQNLKLQAAVNSLSHLSATRGCWQDAG